jgi:hypothetical protein
VQKKLLQKGKARQEEDLRDLASRARLERAGINPDAAQPRAGEDAEPTSAQDAEEGNHEEGREHSDR